MKILLAGATGYIDSSVLTALVSSGHAVTALVRTGEGAPKSIRVCSAPGTCVP